MVETWGKDGSVKQQLKKGKSSEEQLEEAVLVSHQSKISIFPFDVVIKKMIG